MRLTCSRPTTHQIGPTAILQIGQDSLLVSACQSLLAYCPNARHQGMIKRPKCAPVNGQCIAELGEGKRMKRYRQG